MKTILARNNIKVFVSSTVYGFQDVLDNVYTMLDTMGYDVLMSHKGTIPLDSKLSNLENCLRAVENSDVFVGFIRPLRGSGVLDEAVTNAVIHRDYSDMAGEVTIYIYKGKIEIINSGQMPEKMVSGKNKVMPHHSIPRNPQMAEIFHIANKMEKTGRGLGLIASTMEKLGCRLPEWKSKDGYTMITLYNTVETVSMNERTALFMRKMHRGDVFTKADYLEMVGGEISKPTAQSDIQILLKLKHCSKIGNGPQTKYRID